MRRAASVALAALALLLRNAEAIGVMRPEDANMDAAQLAKASEGLKRQVAMGELAGAGFQVYRCVYCDFCAWLPSRLVVVPWVPAAGTKETPPPLSPTAPYSIPLCFRAAPAS